MSQYPGTLLAELAAKAAMPNGRTRNADDPPVLGVDLAAQGLPTDVPLPLEEVCRLAPMVPDPPGPTDIRRRNPRWQGEIGLTDAIGFFGRREMVVSLPLADNQGYDLVVEWRRRLLKVQVKTTTRRSPRGRFEVMLATAGGNQSFHTVKFFDRDAVHLLYVLTDAGDRYVIPAELIEARRGISLGRKWEAFRVDPEALRLRQINE
jgi:hypothetical protein